MRRNYTELKYLLLTELINLVAHTASERDKWYFATLNKKINIRYVCVCVCVSSRACIRGKTYAFIVDNAVKYSWSRVCHWWMTGFINIDGHSSHIAGQSFWFWFSEEDGIENMVIALMTLMMMMMIIIIIIIMLKLVPDIGFFKGNFYWVECETRRVQRHLRVRLESVIQIRKSN